jgi:hypothetical protein
MMPSYWRIDRSSGSSRGSRKDVVVLDSDTLNVAEISATKGCDGRRSCPVVIEEGGRGRNRFAAMSSSKVV